MIRRYKITVAISIGRQVYDDDEPTGAVTEHPHSLLTEVEANLCDMCAREYALHGNPIYACSGLGFRVVVKKLDQNLFPGTRCDHCGQDARGRHNEGYWVA